MNITFRQLRLFLALAETGSVSAAAKVMHVTQPTASMQLREVTQAVGVPLYEVISRSCIDAVGCVTCMRLAAALTLPVSASARKSRSWRKVIFIDFYL